MKRIYLASVFFFLGALAVFHCEITGFFIRSVAQIHSGATISYRTLQFERGQLVVNGLVASKLGGYKFQAERFSIEFHWPASISFQIQKPHLTLSTGLLKKWAPSSPEENLISWSADVDGGILDWMDDALPPGHFTFKKREGSTQLTYLLDRGLVTFEQGRIEWKNLGMESVALLASLQIDAMPISDCKGVWDGYFDGKSLHAEGIDVACKIKDTVCSGTFSLDWHRPDSYSLFPQRFRLSVVDAAVVTPHTSIQEITILSTFQSATGVMCEGSAICDNLPLTFLGKGFFSAETGDWLTGDVNLGNAKANLAWKEGEGVVALHQISPSEIAFLQKLTQSFMPEVAEINWVSGTASGSAKFKEKLDFESLLIEDLFIKSPYVQAGCKTFLLADGNFQTEGGWIDEFQGNARWSKATQEFTLVGIWKGMASHVHWNPSGLMQGEVGECQFSGTAVPAPRGASLSISKIEGKIPPFGWMEGTIVSGTAGLTLDYSKYPYFDDWSVSCHVVNGAFPDWSISETKIDLVANDEGIDLSGTGFYTSPQGHKIFLNAPTIRMARDYAQFDIRFEDGNLDLARIVGVKELSEIKLDGEKSHLFGSKILANDLVWEKGCLSNGSVHTKIQWPVLALSLEKFGVLSNFASPIEEIQVNGAFGIDQCKLAISSGELLAEAEYRNKLWQLSASNADLSMKCNLLTATEALCQVKQGHLKYKDSISLEFEGKVAETFIANLLLQNILVDATVLPVAGLKGILEGTGCVTLSQASIEADLDIQPATISWNDFQIETNSQTNLFYSLESGALIRGLEGRVVNATQEARGKLDLVKFDKLKSRWAIQNGTVHLLGSGLDLSGNVDFSTDLSTACGHINRGSVPIAGSVHTIENFDFVIEPNFWRGSTSVLHRDQWAKISFEMDQDLSGSLSLQEDDADRLTVQWNYEREGFSIRSIEGTFAGVQASFQPAESGLVGSAAIDFTHLCQWIAPEVAEGILDIGMGSGYELKGAISIDLKDPLKSHFKGILTGKQFQFFDFEFRTLMAEAMITPEKIHLHNIKISDSSVLASVDEVLIESSKGHPWTIAIPLLTIENLRPSLLRKPGQEKKDLNPLIVKEFTMRGFSGLLDDGSTYKATGALSFINTFKREETFFDLPSNIFGRIVGIDLDLLVPVVGDLKFNLSDGFFHLNELTNAYSEGKRSEFFLVDAPRVDLRGNLEVFVKMKQFVLFALTEGFLISIDGNLSDPKFRLQKKQTVE